jgi:hypothetical protein
MQVEFRIQYILIYIQAHRGNLKISDFTQVETWDGCILLQIPLPHNAPDAAASYSLAIHLTLYVCVLKHLHLHSLKKSRLANSRTIPGGRSMNITHQ